MAITLPTAKHVQAQHAGVTKSGVNPSKSNPESGVHSIPVYSDMGEIGSMLFGHTIADSVNRTETGTTAVQTGLGGFIPRAKATAAKKTGTFSTAADPGAQNRPAVAVKSTASKVQDSARNVLVKATARVRSLIPRG
jgi:hypothetical protein